MPIVVTCTQTPYNGGAATNAYALIKYLRSEGYNACGVFFLSKEKNVDPDGIGGVYPCAQSSSSSRKAVYNKCKKYLKAEPKVVLAKNYVAPLLSKIIFTKSKVVYLVSGAPNMMEFSKRAVSAKKLKERYNRLSKLKLGTGYSGIINLQEKQCVENIDYFLFNSLISKELFLLNYEKQLKNKNLSIPINTSVFLNNYNINHIRPLEKRKIDILFASSRLTRHVKNFNLALNIFNSKEIIKSGIKIVVVGNNFNNFITKNKNKNVKFMGFQKNSNLIKLMCNTKLVLCTSYFDASPNLISEAISCGSNILCSTNCGWSETYNKASVCKDVYDVNEWNNKIFKLLTTKQHFNLNIEKNKNNFNEYIQRLLI